MMDYQEQFYRDVFSKIKREDFRELIRLCAPYFEGQEVDEDAIIESAYETIKHMGTPTPISDNNVAKVLEKRWYDSLEKGEADYLVYNEPNYLADIWACWILFSRISVKVLGRPTSLVTHSVLDEIGEDGTILDLGCGFAYTTLALQQLLPKAKVYGTNIETSYQFKVAQTLTADTDITILPTFKGIGNVRAAFASEYFEHFDKPLEHLEEVVEACSPEYMIVANGFNGDAIGHFNTYIHRRTVYDAKKMNRLFSKTMRNLGYETMDSTIWNSRPTIWKQTRVLLDA
jgi:hypothetical protein